MKIHKPEVHKKSGQILFPSSYFDLHSNVQYYANQKAVSTFSCLWNINLLATHRMRAQTTGKLNEQTDFLHSYFKIL